MCLTKPQITFVASLQISKLKVISCSSPYVFVVITDHKTSSGMNPNPNKAIFIYGHLDLVIYISDILV